MINQDDIYPSCYGEISMDTPRLSMNVEMHGHAINELTRILMSFVISTCLLIEKAIELDKVTLSMPCIQL